jgi:hypothetical protein
MFWQIIGRLACVVAVSFSQATAGAARAQCEDEIELALAAIGSGSAEEMKSRLISERISLKLLGRNPAGHVRGLRRLQLITKRKGLSDVVSQSHPTLVERMKFSQRFIESLK